MFSILNERLAGLRRRYAEPHRAYHGQAHVDALLRGLAAEDGHVGNRAAVELAIWYHDAIYDPKAADNEARSADLLVAEMHRLACPSLLSAAESMVRATAGHALPPNCPDALRGDMAIFLDLDMAVLGAEPADYDAYEAGIAAEYMPVHGVANFHAGRAAFLRGMLSRERLFLTERFHHRLDAAARTNLRRGLLGLGT
jgi:predicted metal-dependent HD superfamily phosphohydrolase